MATPAAALRLERSSPPNSETRNYDSPFNYLIEGDLPPIRVNGYWGYEAEPVERISEVYVTKVPPELENKFGDGDPNVFSFHGENGLAVIVADRYPHVYREAFRRHFEGRNGTTFEEDLTVHFPNLYTVESIHPEGPIVRSLKKVNPKSEVNVEFGNDENAPAGLEYALRAAEKEQF